MTTVATTPPVMAFHRDLIRAYLLARDLHFGVDSDGDFVVSWRAGDAIPAVRTLFMVQGEDNDILAIRSILPDVTYLPERYPAAVAAANRWNAMRRWPKLVATSDHFMMEFDLSLAAGVHPQLLANLLDLNLATTYSCANWLRDDAGFGGANS